uniref:angiopoietin-related protein 3-like isoform X2 n=1 Tax=Myxine glutinosa TaxID=7769 RepID=UPI00358FD331
MLMASIHVLTVVTLVSLRIMSEFGCCAVVVQHKQVKRWLEDSREEKKEEVTPNDDEDLGTNRRQRHQYRNSTLDHTSEADGREDSGSEEDEELAKNKGSMRENIDILAHGVLQLGTALRHVAERTTRQVSEALGRLKLAGTRLETIAGRAQNLREGQIALQKRATRLEEKEMQQNQEAAELKARMHLVAKEKVKLEERLLRLEQETMHKAHVGSLDIRNLKEVMNSQNQSIWEIVAIIHSQTKKLDEQNNKLLQLQEQLRDIKNDENNNQEFEWEDDLEGNESQNITTEAFPKHCHDIYMDGNRSSGMHVIQPDGAPRFWAFCQMREDGGWTVFQHRIDGSMSFDQDWESYKNGFGNLTGGWWFSDCGDANLNGVLLNEQRGSGRKWRCRGMLWKPWRGRQHIIRTTTMMLRPMDQSPTVTPPTKPYVTIKSSTHPFTLSPPT